TARPAPYDLLVKPRLKGDELTLDFINQGRQGAVFALYPAPGEAPLHYTVAAKSRLSDVWKVGPAGYDLRVHGPNGALWHLRGDSASAYEVSLSEEGGGRVLEVDVINRSRTAQTFLVGDLAYGDGLREVRVAAGDDRTVNLKVGPEGWYDVTVAVRGDLTFRRRIAGRFPWDERTLTDPAIGLADPLAVEVTLGAASATIDEPILLPGRPAKVTATFTATAAALTQLEAQPVVPPGWAIAPVTAPPASLAAGASASAVWEVTPPAVLPDGAAYRLLVTARALAGDRFAVADGELAARTAPVMAGHLLGEDFESLAGVLRPESGLLGWTAQAPAGWSVVNASGMPQGTVRLQGWTFHTKREWAALGAQDREKFTRALGIVAVADPDDWDDTGSPSRKGVFDSTLVSPAVPIPAGAEALYLAFDSHYRQEAPQKASVTAVFDNGTEARLVFYSADATGNDNAGKDVQNAQVTRRFAVPAGARSVTLKFRMYDAGNNWYWAVDHVRLDTRPISG
ncbi:phospholipase domain-containing protein, partial [Streptomyces sp. FH025]|uniref:phospholipase domain-containing protein n=1 Tax=Streptomyces sp. FH025 TaxID=2815937 RepID=UPI001A9D1D73